MNPLSRYARWLHLKWPAGTVENLPRVEADGSTNVPGLYVVGDLTGVPLLKFSSDTGARAVRTICREAGFGAQGSGNARETAPEPPSSSAEPRAPNPEPLDLVIIGAGVSGYAAALEARKAGLRFVLLESAEPFATLVNFPARKPIYTYPTGMIPAGDLQFRADVHPKEQLVADVRALTRGIEPLAARAERVVRGA